MGQLDIALLFFYTLLVICVLLSIFGLVKSFISNDDGVIKYKEYLAKNNYRSKNFGKNDNKKLLYSKELELCESFLKDNPKNNYAIERKATLLYELERYSEAIEIYESKLNKPDPDYKSSYLKNYAFCLAKIGEIDAAFNAIDRFIDVKERDDEYYSMIANIYKATREYDKAIDNYNMAIKYKPDNPEYYLKRAEVYKILNKQAEYDADIKQAEKFINEYLI